MTRSAFDDKSVTPTGSPAPGILGGDEVAGEQQYEPDRLDVRAEAGRDVVAERELGRI